MGAESSSSAPMLVRNVEVWIRMSRFAKWWWVVAIAEVQRAGESGERVGVMNRVG